jgi:hypothetical protein
MGSYAYEYPIDRQHRWWRTPLVMLVIVIGTFACLGALVLFVDTTCANEAATWIPLYPDAEIVRVNHTGMRPFGMGSTVMQLYTPDDIMAVRTFYREQRAGLDPAKANSGLASMLFNLQEADGGGTQIVLTSECASE